ncbi:MULTISPECIES: hypothetical protein [Staphylococcus]|uniref:Uncharacterized protein n=3 Tax=Staphylococcus TaxID=1279 RepID=A0AB37H4U8_9STAP|nr:MULTISPECIES: hypothetical protein [Staphylococcus]AMY06003.1 hypothetical protein A4G25_08695 [Staphylococcus condimenti]APR59867.1 hypothetical protein BTZ13_00985 [Staphylococcus condimenti]KKB25647.1 hypothetical protein VV61_06085 [Staphylococcus carnosus]KOR12539.1 hypothetical protein AMC75_08650 [Staphylococcus carnosus]MDK8644995.1 hypothetical protein [Staphylococcus condimenti]
MPFVEDRMMKDLEEKPSRVEEGNFNTDQEMQQNAFERLGKDVVIIEILSIMNIVFAVTTFTLLGLFIRATKNK